MAIYVNNNNVNYFGSFGVEHSPKDIKNSYETKVS